MTEKFVDGELYVNGKFTWVEIIGVRLKDCPNCGVNGKFYITKNHGDVCATCSTRALVRALGPNYQPIGHES